MKKILIFLLVFITLKINGQGLKLSSPEQIQSYNKLPTDKFGFAENIPSFYNLEPYVPPVMNQTGGTCVGFASFYYALSTMYNVKFGILNNREKYIHSFDPYYIYSITFNNLNDCDNQLDLN